MWAGTWCITFWLLMKNEKTEKSTYVRSEYLCNVLEHLCSVSEHLCSISKQKKHVTNHPDTLPGRSFKVLNVCIVLKNLYRERR